MRVSNQGHLSLLTPQGASLQLKAANEIMTLKMTLQAKVKE